MNAIDIKVLSVIPFSIDTANGSYVCSKGLAIETSVIHSHFTPALSWCLSTATLSGASKRQKHTLTSLLNIMFTCVTPNSSRGELLNSFICSSLKGIL